MNTLEIRLSVIKYTFHMVDGRLCIPRGLFGEGLEKKLFLITTETSGDLLAGRLLNALNQMKPALNVQGVGGQSARASGMNCLYSVEDFNVMGLFEVLGQLKRLKAQFNVLVEHCKKWRPSAVVLIDAPDFNIRFAKALKGTGIPIIYYVSPQVWAWRAKRARVLADLVDHMLVLFDFEKQIYTELGLKATWVGHSLVDEIESHKTDAEFVNKIDRREGQKIITLAPGSRKSELKRHLPIYQDLILKAPEQFRFLLPLAPALSEADLGPLAFDKKIDVLPGKMRDAMSMADAAVVASGTATLETGLMGVPMVVGYKMKPLSYLLARKLVKVDHIALVNIVLKKRVVPELIQSDFTAEKIWEELEKITLGGGERSKMKAEFMKLRQILGGGGAAVRAAEAVGAYL